MTEKEKQLAAEMIELADKIKTETAYINTRERIPHLQLEMIVSKIKALHDKAVILSYLHKNADSLVEDQTKHAFENVTAERNSYQNEINSLRLQIQELKEAESLSSVDHSQKVVSSEPVLTNRPTPDQESSEPSGNGHEVHPIVPPVIVEVELQSSIQGASVNQTSLNDKLSDSGKQTVAGKIGSKSVKDLKSAIGLNEKFAYQKELFHGDSEKYKAAIERLGQVEQDQAEDVFFGQMALENGWETDNSLVQSLWVLVQKRFV